MADDHSTGDPIPEVFDPDRIDARFVVAMSMARNDIEVALRDGIAAAADDRPDFAYRVRLVTSHLVEALDSLNAYSQERDVKKLIARVPTRKKQLNKARSVLQKVASTVLDQVRNNTFHFPSPKTSFSPSSDEQVRNVLADMSDRPCELHLDHRGEHPVVTLTFAGSPLEPSSAVTSSTRRAPPSSGCRRAPAAPSRSCCSRSRWLPSGALGRSEPAQASAEVRPARALLWRDRPADVLVLEPAPELRGRARPKGVLAPAPHRHQPQPVRGARADDL